jgi:hypothetical protein
MGPGYDLVRVGSGEMSLAAAPPDPSGPLHHHGTGATLLDHI